MVVLVGVNMLIISAGRTGWSYCAIWSLHVKQLKAVILGITLCAMDWLAWWLWLWIQSSHSHFV